MDELMFHYLKKIYLYELDVNPKSDVDKNLDLSTSIALKSLKLKKDKDLQGCNILSSKIKNHLCRLNHLLKYAKEELIILQKNPNEINSEKILSLKLKIQEYQLTLKKSQENTIK